MAAMLTPLAAKGAAELIALLGVGVAAGSAVAATSNERVGVTPLTLTPSRTSDLHVGDHLYLSTQFTVSYGDLFGGGTMRIELFEEGCDHPIAAREHTTNTDAESFTINFSVRGKKHGTASYHVRVTVTGEDDVPVRPWDWDAVRTAESNMVALTFERPIQPEVVLNTAEIIHGQQSRAQLFGTNRSELPVFTHFLFERPLYYAFPPDSPRLEIARRHDPHDAPHPAEFPRQDFFLETRLVIEQVIVPVEHGAVAIYMGEPYDLDTQTVTCRRGEDTKVGLILDPWDTRAPREVAVAVGFAATSSEGEPIACKGWLEDDYGGAIALASDASGRVVGEGTLRGLMGRLHLMPRDARWQTFESAVRLTDLSELSRALFHPAVGPTLRGVVVDEGTGAPVGGAELRLRHPDTGEVIAREWTDASGRFRFPTHRRDWGDAGIRVDAVLPARIGFDWSARELSRSVTLHEAARTLRIGARRVTTDAATITLAGRAVTRDSLSQEWLAVPGAHLRLLTEAGAVAGESVSGADGAYRLTVAPGVYTLAVDAPAGFSDSPRIKCSLGVDREDLQLRLRRLAPSIVAERSDALIGSTGSLAAGEEVVLIGEHGVPLGHVISGEHGRFEIPITLLPPGAEKIRLGVKNGVALGKLSRPLALGVATLEVPDAE